MTFDKIRKMGIIADELKKHGLVADSGEAMSQAEEMIISGSPNETGFVSQKELHEQKAQTVEEEQKAEPTSREFEVFKRDMTAKYNDVISDFDLMRNKINEIIAKINELENKVQARPKQEVQATLSSPAQPQEAPAPAAAPTPPPAPAPSAPANQAVPGDKSGYSPDDVSVNKIFYVGNK